MYKRNERELFKEIIREQEIKIEELKIDNGNLAEFLIISVICIVLLIGLYGLLLIKFIGSFN